MKNIFKILFIILLVFLLVSAAGLLYLSHGLKKGTELELTGITLSKLKDGEYNGKYTSGRWSNQLNVTIKNHKIVEINILDDVTFIKKGVSDKLFKKVIKTQNTKVDAISQATVTSKAYLKSIENALNN